MHHVADGHDGVIPSVDGTKEFQEFAHELHKMYVKESWWTRSSMLLLYVACVCVTVTFFVLWLILLNAREPSWHIWVMYGLDIFFIFTHMVSDNRIHRRFRTEHPEDYKIWQQSRWTYRSEE
jgi:hypothetical protein